MKTWYLALGLALAVSPMGAEEKKPAKKPRVDLPGDGSVKADPAPKRNPVGDKVSDYKPTVKVKPAKEPPSPTKK
jgi:hypothetical protein